MCAVKGEWHGRPVVLGCKRDVCGVWETEQGIRRATAGPLGVVCDSRATIPESRTCPGITHHITDPHPPVGGASTRASTGEPLPQPLSGEPLPSPENLIQHPHRSRSFRCIVVASFVAVSISALRLTPPTSAQSTAESLRTLSDTDSDFQSQRAASERAWQLLPQRRPSRPAPRSVRASLAGSFPSAGRPSRTSSVRVSLAVSSPAPPHSLAVPPRRRASRSGRTA